MATSFEILFDCFLFVEIYSLLVICFYNEYRISDRCTFEEDSGNGEKVTIESPNQKRFINFFYYHLSL